MAAALTGSAGRFAGSDLDMQMLVANGLAAMAASAPEVAGLVDVFTGPTNGLNSGEIPLNILIGAIPMVTGALGGFAGVAATPGLMATIKGEKVEDVARNMKEWAMNQQMMGRTAPPTPEEIAMAEVVGRRKAAADADLINAARRIDRALPEGITAAQAKAVIDRAGMRRMGWGALAGSLAGGVPAIMMMQDRPSQVPPAAPGP